MKYYTSTTEFNCGIDLHSRQMYVCVMDRAGNKLVHTNIQGNDFVYFLKRTTDVEEARSREREICYGELLSLDDHGLNGGSASCLSAASSITRSMERNSWMRYKVAQFGFVASFVLAST